MSWKAGVEDTAYFFSPLTLKNVLQPPMHMCFCSAVSFVALLPERMLGIIQMFPLYIVCIAIAAEINIMGLAWQDLWTVP